MTTFVSLPKSQRKLLPNSRLTGRVDPSETASLTIHVRSAGDPKALEAEVLKQSKLPLSQRKYLTREELAKQHGARPADLDAIEQYAQNHDLIVVHRSAAERSIVLKGKLGDLLKAFPANVQMYHHATGTYRGRQGEVQVPQELSGLVTGVFGYDTRPKHRHTASVSHADGPGGDNGEPATFFAQRYNFPPQLDGTGQTIAIIELGGGYTNSDLQVFFQEIGVSLPSVTAVSVDHAGNNPTTPDSADGEVMLDIEVAGAVAPKAKYVVYFAPNQGDKGFLDAINTAINDTEHKPSVISISWGGPEEGIDQQTLDAFHTLFVNAAAVGITVCIASGDHGTADLDASDWDGNIHVDHPASDPMALGCGGTQIVHNKDVVWNDGTPFDATKPGGGGWASGGGISQAFPVPDYQQNANIPVSIIENGKAGRGVPDIAMSATNYFTRVDNTEGASGGTSAVAPLMAALVALLNQSKGKPVGFLNPFLYANASKVTHDVTSGTNAIKNTVKGYEAGTGWDACTGLGTPDGSAILANLQ
jgi:kumamolisin